MNIKNAIRKLANRFGYDIRSLTSDLRKIRTTTGESYTLVRGLGFQPKTIIDVGAAAGTPELYAAYPDSYFLLVEPLKEFESDLRSILKRHKGSYILAAASSSSGRITFNVHKDYLYGSSLYKESMGTDADGYEVTVPTIRIDETVQDKQLQGPFLIKVDVQGAELDVLEGAQQTLSKAEVVVLEVSFFEFMKGAPQFSDIILYMKNHDFVAYDIIHG